MRRVFARLARLRVPLGFAFAIIVFVAARPTAGTLVAGGVLAMVGEAIRVWAAGHLEKGREVTSSGPYRWTRHPLYVGSAIIGAGIAVAANSWLVLLIVALYLSVTLTAAIRTEEAFLRATFGDQYDAYCEGRTVSRRFSLSRALRNREHRAIGGLVLGLGLLVVRMALGPRL